MKLEKIKDVSTGSIVICVSDVRSSACRERIENISYCKKTLNGYVLPNWPFIYNELRYLQSSDLKMASLERKRIKKEKEYRRMMEEYAERFAFVESIQQKIMKKQMIDAPENSSTELMNHQRGGSRIAELFNRFAFFYDTGTGKTLMALDIIHQKEITSDAHFLVLCPKTIINPAWMEDQKRFYPKLKLLPLSNNISIEQYKLLKFSWREDDKSFKLGPAFFVSKKRDRDDAVRKDMMLIADHLIVNYEKFNKSPDEYLFLPRGYKNIPIDGIIVDESSILKSGYTVTYTNIVKALSDYNIKYLYLFSGKPAPNKLIEYYPQIKLVAPYLRMPRKDDICSQSNNSEKAFLDCIRKVSITVSKQDCFDLPPTIQVVRKISLGQGVMQQYNSMATHYFAEVKQLEKDTNGDKFVIVNHILASIAKLRQLTGGFVIDNDGNRLQIHREKLVELLSVISELGASQAIIWCQYQHEVEAIDLFLRRSGFSTVTAYGKTKDKDSSISLFKEGKSQFLIAHPRTLQYGVTLTNCSYAIYYSTSYSFEEYYQSHDRIYRYGQKVSCTYIFLQAEKTIDEIMYRAIMGKKNKAEITELFLKHLQAPTA